MDTMEFLVDSRNGIYVPQAFAEQFGDSFGIAEEDRKILLEGPDHADYWETWDTVLGYAKHEEDMPSPYAWTLYENEGDLWAVREDHIWEEDEENY